MATIVNTLRKAVEFDKARHATQIDGKGRAVGARPIVAAADGAAALRLIGSPDVAEWVVNGATHVTKGGN